MRSPGIVEAFNVLKKSKRKFRKGMKGDRKKSLLLQILEKRFGDSIVIGTALSGKRLRKSSLRKTLSETKRSILRTSIRMKQNVSGTLSESVGRIEGINNELRITFETELVRDNSAREQINNDTQVSKAGSEADESDIADPYEVWSGRIETTLENVRERA